MSTFQQAPTGRSQQETGSEFERNLEETIAAAMRAAQNARAEASAAAVAAQQASPEQPANPPAPGATQNAEPGGDFTIRVGPDGLLLVQEQADGTEITTPWDASNIIPPQVTDIMLIAVLGFIGMILAFPIGRAIARYIDRRGAVSKTPDGIERRLAAIEDSVQAVAVEVERLSETNRYTARLLSERVAAPDFRPGDVRQPQQAQHANEAKDTRSAHEAHQSAPESVSSRSTWQAS